jgi:sugar phosphate isomerase/epimerase
MARYGVNAVELFCARGHFDYQSAEAGRELAGVLRDSNLELHAIHAPSERRSNAIHENALPLSISDPERTRRIEAVDEIKRALDLAEQIPFRYMVQHMASSRDDAAPRRFEAAFNSLEHLHIFAKERGVTIALENTPGELSTPANLRQFLAETRLNGIRLCLDIGHAHIGDGVLPTIEAMRDLLVTSHIHDNHGEKDEHLLPFDGTIEWEPALAALPRGLPLVMELKEQPAYAEPVPATVALAAVQGAFEKLEREMESAQA